MRTGTVSGGLASASGSVDAQEESISDQFKEGHVGGLARNECGGRGPRHAIRVQTLIAESQTAFSQLAVTGHILQNQRAFALDAAFDREALHRARQIEVKPRAILGRKRILVRQRPADVDHMEGFRDGVSDCPSRVRSGQIQPIGHRHGRGGYLPASVAPNASTILAGR